MSHVCVDACFLIGLYDYHDQHHNAASDHFSRLFDGGYQTGHIVKMSSKTASLNLEDHSAVTGRSAPSIERSEIS
jgi:predicted nucleic acid-binding protein